MHSEPSNAVATRATPRAPPHLQQLRQRVAGRPEAAPAAEGAAREWVTTPHAAAAIHHVHRTKAAWQDEAGVVAARWVLAPLARRRRARGLRAV